MLPITMLKLIVVTQYCSPVEILFANLQRGKAPAPGGKVTNQCVMSSFVSAAHVALGQAGYNGRLRTEREHCECLGKAAAVACPVSQHNYTAR